MRGAVNRGCWTCGSFADFVAGAALGERRSADFVAGTALGEPRSADFVAGAALCEPRSVDFVALPHISAERGEGLVQVLDDLVPDRFCYLEGVFLPSASCIAALLELRVVVALHVEVREALIPPPSFSPPK